MCFSSGFELCLGKRRNKKNTENERQPLLSAGQKSIENKGQPLPRPQPRPQQVPQPFSKYGYPANLRDRVLIRNEPPEFNEFEGSGTHFVTDATGKPLGLIDSSDQDLVFRWGRLTPMSCNPWFLYERASHYARTLDDSERKRRAAEIAALGYGFLHQWSKDYCEHGEKNRTWHFDDDYEMCEILKHLGTWVTVDWKDGVGQYLLIQVEFNPVRGQFPNALLRCKNATGKIDHMYAADATIKELAREEMLAVVIDEV